MPSEIRSTVLTINDTDTFIYSGFLDTVWADARKSSEDTCYLADMNDVFMSHNFGAVDRCIVAMHKGRGRFPSLSISSGSPATLVKFPSGNGRAYVDHGIFSLPEKAILYATGGAGALFLLASDEGMMAHEISVSSASAATLEVRCQMEERRKLARNGNRFGPRFSGSLARACTTFARVEIDDEAREREHASWTEEIPF